MLKSAHSPVFTGEILFFVAQKCADFNVSLSAKVTPTPILTIDAKNRPICTLFGTVKKWHFGKKWHEKVTIFRA